MKDIILRLVYIEKTKARLLLAGQWNGPKYFGTWIKQLRQSRGTHSHTTDIRNYLQIIIEKLVSAAAWPKAAFPGYENGKKNQTDIVKVQQRIKHDSMKYPGKTMKVLKILPENNASISRKI